MYIKEIKYCLRIPVYRKRRRGQFLDYLSKYIAAAAAAANSNELSPS
jgi:hypothetical protein